MKSVIKQQRGLSLVELLIAMALGLLLTVGALQMMLSSQGLYRTTDSLSRIQESGRFALDFLAKDIRMAGYNTEYLVALYNEPCGASFTSCTEDGGGATSDRIGIMLEPSRSVDCLGNAVADDVVNVYYLKAVNGISSLYCRGLNPISNTWNSGEQPLVDGVENMQILYGIKKVNNIKGSEEEGALEYIETYVPASPTLDFTSVATVRIALLVNNGQVNGNGDKASRSFTLLNAPQQDFDDKHQRQVYTSTISINNAIYIKDTPS